MSITTLAQMTSSMLVPFNYFKVQTITPVAGSWYSLWTYDGIPGAGAIPSNIGIKGTFYTSLTAMPAGGMRFPAPVTGETVYLARFSGNANVTGTIVLADRIWADSLSIADTANMSAASNTIFSGSFPRSAGTGGGDSSGIGIFLGMEVYTTLGAAASTPIATIVNSAGVADTIVCWSAVPASAVAGTFVPMYSVIPRNGVTAGSNAFGVRSVSRFFNPTNHRSGVWGMTAFRPITRVCVVSSGIEEAVDALTAGFPILFPNSVPTLFWISGTVTPASGIMGGLSYAQG